MENKIILLIDDDCDDVEFFTEAIETSQEKITLRCAEDGIEAFKMLSEMNQDEMPSLIIVDAGMPKMNGWEFIKLLKENTRFTNIPISMLATSSRRKGIDDARDLGADAYIVKPSDFKDLKFLIQNICAAPVGELKSKLLQLQVNSPDNIFVFTDN